MIDHRRFLPIRHRKEGAPVFRMALCVSLGPIAMKWLPMEIDHTKRNWGLLAIRCDYRKSGLLIGDFWGKSLSTKNPLYKNEFYGKLTKFEISIIFTIYVLPCSSSTNNASTKYRSLQNDRFLFIYMAICSLNGRLREQAEIPRPPSSGCALISSYTLKLFGHGHEVSSPFRLYLESRSTNQYTLED